MLNKQKEQLPGLDPEVASAIIANVFDACGQTPSTVPLDVLASYTQYRRDRFSLQKNILIFILVVFLLLPLLFVSPHFQVKEIGKAVTGAPIFEVSVNNLIPVRLVSARLNDRSVAVYESQAKVFTVEPITNGHLTVTVTLANQQYDIWSTEIGGVDASAPLLLGSEVVDGNLRIYLDDQDGVGVDYKNIYAVSSEHPRLSPTDYDIEKNYVDIAYPGDLNIFIPDFNGNTLQLVLTIRE